MKNETENPLLRKGYRTGEKALTSVQVDQLLDKITNLHDLGLVQLGISTGMRREDIVSVKSGDINIDNCSVTFYEHKKKKSRTIYISENVVNTLRMIIKVNNKSTYLFPSRSKKTRSGHLSGRAAYNILNKYLRLAGLPSKPFHSLRGTCYKLCQKKGWSPEMAAEHIGDTLGVAQRHYAVPSQEELKEAATTKAII